MPKTDSSHLEQEAHRNGVGVLGSGIGHDRDLRGEGEGGTLRCDTTCFVLVIISSLKETERERERERESNMS